MLRIRGAAVFFWQGPRHTLRKGRAALCGHGERLCYTLRYSLADYRVKRCLPMGTPEGARLTTRQLRFAELVADGYTGKAAAEKAGYAKSGAHTEAYRLTRHPVVRERIHGLRRATIETDMAHLALSTMRELMQDKEGTPAATRYKAAEWTLKAAGLAGADPADERRDKPMEEMSGEELAQAISSGMDALREIAGALDGQHIIDGERRQVREIPADPEEVHIVVGAEEETDFLD